VPTLSAIGAVVLLFASLLVFGLLMRRLGDLQITNTLRFIGDQGREVIRQTIDAASHARRPSPCHTSRARRAIAAAPGTAALCPGL